MIIRREEIVDQGEDLTQIPFSELMLPLPYKCMFLITLGVWFWYVNLRTCYAYKIDTLQVLKLAGVEHAKLVRTSLNVCYKITLMNMINYTVYLAFVSNSIYFSWMEFLPLVAIVQTVAVLVWPFGPQSIERRRFVETVKRISVGNIDISLRNNDILLADTFTSYTKVLIDFLVYFTALLLGYATLPSPDIKRELTSDHLKVYNLDIVLSSYPSLIRLKQCLQEYEQSRRRNRQHLLNAIKYSTAFLPLLANILIRSQLAGLGVWYAAVLINSSYTFFWDIQNDWNFQMFMRFLSNKRELPLLRHKLVYTWHFYYLAILLDFQLRFIWVYRLIFPELLSRLDHSLLVTTLSSLYVTESGNFVLEVLEIFRRWVWVFLKVETEFLKLATEPELEMQNL
ncbi:hypothetical protein OGAPHI_006115 [Ogataea philodendri]|uniref:EXS domain-containing protein n=1 Tax=Ogataea philodendri TaxID=1378263 RepID=A0A9P8T0X7_9ASCO|nr:uncharacterized protein OGAPHI_006115 [Ogataea philodendri]KAH3661936.1 hypothetical protein OGAPHI_006115 [Ogataea philodendri]